MKKSINITELHKIVKVFILLIIIDSVWLSTAGKYAMRVVERIQGKKSKVHIPSALLVYIFLTYLLLQTETYEEAFLTGVCTYGVFDFTNLAIFEKYDIKLAVADTLWGGILMVITKYLMSLF